VDVTADTEPAKPALQEHPVETVVPPELAGQDIAEHEPL
jgi:hypothetical protein